MRIIKTKALLRKCANLNGKDVPKISLQILLKISVAVLAPNCSRLYCYLLKELKVLSKR
jgi:hypothetical protein